MATAASLRTRLKTNLGRRKDTVLIDDDALDVWLGEALREVNRHFPKTLVGSFTTASGTQSYAPLTGISGARKLLEVFWDPDGLSIDVGPVSETDEAGVIHYAGAFADLAASRLREWRLRAFGGTATIMDAAVYLDPVPTSAVAVYFLYTGARFADVTVVDDEADQCFMAYAEFRGHSALAVGDGGMRTVTSPTGVGFTTDAASHHKAAAEKAYARFLDSLPPLSPFRAQP